MAEAKAERESAAEPAEATHTPGPWRWETFIGDNGGQFRRLEGADNKTVLDGEYGANCDEADARLIEAAPDLYDAADSAWRLLMSIIPADGSNGPMNEVLHELNEALHNATYGRDEGP